MEVASDGTYPTDWLVNAACVGSYDHITWHWAEAPSDYATAPALEMCASCPVKADCLEDMIAQNEGYKWQVRAGLKLWEDNDLPEIQHRYRGNANKYAQDRELAPRARGGMRSPRPAGIPGYRDHNIPPTGVKINPHTRGPHNTPTESDTP